MILMELFREGAFCIAGDFFGSHFLMGGERFETGQPEAYLFGENTDLNFLGGKAVQVIV